MTRSIRLTAFLTALVAAPALAAAAPDMHGKCERAPARRAAKLAQYDANGDGQLDRAERKQMRQERRAARLAQYDANGDGRLEAAEKAILRQDRVAKMMARRDADGDGVLSRAEAGGQCSRLARRFERIDADQSGTLSAAELEAVKHKRFRRGKHRRGHRGGSR